MNLQRVLVFPAGTEIAYEIHNALKFSKCIELYGINSIPCHGEFLFERYINEDIPFIRHPDFIEKFNEILDKYKIDIVYPAHDTAGLFLTRDTDSIHAKIVTSPLETVEICRSKIRTYRFFEGYDFIPKYYPDIKSIEKYPVFIKPDVGQGAVGAHIANDEAELRCFTSDGKEYAICEYLPGDEYTVDCFTDRSGKVIVCRPRKRERIKAGIAVRSSLCAANDDIIRITQAINSKLKFNGAWFFQLKKNASGQYRLMEISPRIPGTMATSRVSGINFPLLSIRNMLGLDVDITDNDVGVTLDRAFINRYRTNVKYDSVYVKFEGCIYLNEKVNLTLLDFCYQCVNKGIPLYLITNDMTETRRTLKKLRISDELFNEIIPVNDLSEIPDHIRGTDPIFITDSFDDKKEVKDKLGIPVYELDMVESLLDWRM